MGVTRDLRIRLTTLQYEIVRNKAQIEGYKTITAFIRDSILKENCETEELIKQIHEMIVKGEK